MNDEWLRILWILVPLVAIIGGITYSIIRLRYRGLERGSDTASLELLLRQSLDSQRSVNDRLATIDGRLTAIERALSEVPS